MVVHIENCYRVHRLVVATFIRELTIGEEVNHKNTIKADNRVENLEIVTHRVNMLMTVYSGRKDSKPVKQIDKQGNLVAFFPSMGEASRLTNIDYSSIQHCVKGMSKTAGGYTWE